MEQVVFRTAHQQRRAEKHEAICKEYDNLIATKGRAKTIVIEHICSKFDVSMGTVYKILKARKEQCANEEEVIA